MNDHQLCMNILKNPSSLGPFYVRVIKIVPTGSLEKQTKIEKCQKKCSQ